MERVGRAGQEQGLKGKNGIGNRWAWPRGEIFTWCRLALNKRIAIITLWTSAHGYVVKDSTDGIGGTGSGTRIKALMTRTGELT